MGREVRRVPPNWQHPKDYLGNDKPMYDRRFEGDFWDQSRGHGPWKRESAEAFVNAGWAPTGMRINGGPLLGPRECGVDPQRPARDAVTKLKELQGLVASQGREIDRLRTLLGRASAASIQSVMDGDTLTLTITAIGVSEASFFSQCREQLGKLASAIAQQPVEFPEARDTVTGEPLKNSGTPAVECDGSDVPDVDPEPWL